METTLRNTKTKITGTARNGMRGTEISLQPRETYRLDSKHGDVRITSLSGSIWVTQTGDEQDYLLRAGEQVALERRGRIVLQGMSDSRARIVTSNS